MHQIILLHTSPSSSFGTVVQTTHADFLLHDTVEVSWPLNPIIGAPINVVLMHGQERYLASWITDKPPLLNQYTYAVLMQLPKVRHSLG